MNLDRRDLVYWHQRSTDARKKKLALYGGRIFRIRSLSENGQAVLTQDGCRGTWHANVHDLTPIADQPYCGMDHYRLLSEYLTQHRWEEWSESSEDVEDAIAVGRFHPVEPAEESNTMEVVETVMDNDLAKLASEESSVEEVEPRPTTTDKVTKEKQSFPAEPEQEEQEFVVDRILDIAQRWDDNGCQVAMYQLGFEGYSDRHDGDKNWYSQATMDEMSKEKVEGMLAAFRRRRHQQVHKSTKIAKALQKDARERDEEEKQALLLVATNQAESRAERAERRALDRNLAEAQQKVAKNTNTGASGGSFSASYP